MIDYENKIFTDIYNAVIASYPNAFISAVEVLNEPTFPAVFVNFEDSAPTPRYVNSSRSEPFRDMVVDVNVYSNLQSGRRTQAKAIMAIIDAEMAAMGFVQSAMNPLDLTNSRNKLVTRLFARYTASVDVNGVFYSRR